MKSTYRRIISFMLIAGLAAAASADEGVNVTVSKIKGLNLRIYGFIESDFIADTTAGFTEEQDNNLVPAHTAFTSRGDLAAPATVAGGNPTVVQNFAGDHHRTEMSIRNSRLGFDLTVPKTDSGLDTEAIIELDMLGNNATNTQPGTAPGTQTERDFFNNPAVRVRHAYVNLTYDDQFNAKLGQYWSLLGWQPYYFPGETIVMPAVGQLYRRFAQARFTHTLKIQDAATLESAVDAAKPAEMNSGSPEWHGGLRLASTKYKAGTASGSGSGMVGLSAAVSGALIPIETNSLGNPVGQAYALDAAIPIIPSKDGKDRSNTLIAMGEFTEGNGIGGLELPGATMGVAGVGVNAGTPNSNAIDSGIAGTNLAGNVELIKLRAFRYNMEYTLPNPKWAISSGYAEIAGRNLNRFGAPGNVQPAAATANTVASWAGIAPRIQYGYGTVFYDCTSWLRFAAEVNQTRTTYNDPNNRFATNNRYQFTTFFVF